VYPTHLSSGSVLNLFTKLLREDAGQDLIEYVLVAALISLGAVTAMTTLRTKISDAFSTVASTMTSDL
jgi:pilus assembly protein Flp/PilA